ncbi:kinase-like domain-containing protein [Tribonema minus]|uniref:Aurora kinase n=1 Tax=Tribonema minus TaxID=303371 RepID=A0A835ZAW1_9STRA|nr:kinase-like domain-containing protein [Tribonema minus]
MDLTKRTLHLGFLRAADRQGADISSGSDDDSVDLDLDLRSCAARERGSGGGSCALPQNSPKRGKRPRGASQIPTEAMPHVSRSSTGRYSVATAGGPRQDWTLSDFEMGDRLGQGAFGAVWLARERRSKYIVAVKCVRKSLLIESGLEGQLRREVEIQGHLRHRHILRMLGIFSDASHIYLVLEFARYIAQVSSALAYCHSKHVIHRDVKPENLLIGYDGEVRLADFGWSVHTMTNRRQTFCGTLDYLAPELVEGHSHSTAVDNWQVGVLLYELLTGTTPFQDGAGGVMASPARVIHVEYTVPPSMPDGAKTIIAALLKRSPEARMPLENMAVQPWIRAHCGCGSSTDAMPSHPQQQQQHIGTPSTAALSDPGHSGSCDTGAVLPPVLEVRRVSASGSASSSGQPSPPSPVHRRSDPLIDFPASILQRGSRYGSEGSHAAAAAAAASAFNSGSSSQAFSSNGKGSSYFKSLSSGDSPLGAATAAAAAPPPLPQRASVLSASQRVLALVSPVQEGESGGGCTGSRRGSAFDALLEKADAQLRDHVRRGSGSSSGSGGGRSSGGSYVASCVPEGGCAASLAVAKAGGLKAGPRLNGGADAASSGALLNGTATTVQRR